LAKEFGFGIHTSRGEGLRPQVHGRNLGGPSPTRSMGEGELDEGGLRANIRRYIDSKLMDGIFCGQFISEYWALTGAERKRAAEVVLDETKGAVPVVVHIGHHSAKESVELAPHAELAGATYIAVGPPPVPGHRLVIDGNDSGAYDYFHYISERTEIGIVLVNTMLARITLAPVNGQSACDLENVVAPEKRIAAQRYSRGAEARRRPHRHQRPE